MKRVLLTGAAGFIGAHTVQHFLQNTDWHIIMLDSLEHKGDKRRLDYVTSTYPPERYTFVKHDLNNPLTEDLKVDYIINMASESHVDRSIDDPVPFVHNNINCALTMLEYARKYPCEKFIQISTDEVYGAAPQGIDHREWATQLPSNPYSASKSAQEALAISYWRTYGIPVMITNTMNNFGEMQDTEKYIPMVVKRITDGEKVTIHGGKEGIGSRFYLHARNHADALLFILTQLEPTEYVDGDGIVKPSRFNIVGDIELNNLQVADRIAELMGKELDYVLVDFHKTRPGHDRRYALDGRYLRNLGWNPPVNFDDSLRRMIEWTKEHPEWIQ